MTRLLVTAALLVFIVGLAFLTLATISKEGLTLGTTVSVFVVVLLFVGIVGAIVGSLRNPPRG
jgi:positive regulator of sigma E activity